MDYQAFQTRLANLVDDGYRDFVIKGVPTDYPLLGVRVPHLREFAKEITENNQAADFLSHEPQSFEELDIYGMVIAALPYEEMLTHLDTFVSLIDNWAICDNFVSSLKSIPKHRANFLGTIDKLLPGPEFSARVALVCLKCYYITPDYLAVIFDRIVSVKDREEYYVQMAIAWLIAECFIKFPDETWDFLAAKILPKWTQNKAISKIRDSYRVDRELKSRLLTLKI